MVLTELTLNQFKNHSESKILLRKGIIAFCGKNGSGKTSVLEATATLALGKAYFFSDKANIQHQTDFFRITGNVENALYSIALGNSYPKKITRNNIPFDKLIDHLGNIPICILRPEDTLLITSGSATRRQFLDRTISQLNKEYAQNVVQYQNLLKERLAVLKSITSESQLIPHPVLDVLEQQLVSRNQVIHNARKKFFLHFEPAFLSLIQDWCPENEKFTCKAKFHCPELEEWKHARQKDWLWKQNKIGCQKDDINLQLNGMPLKEIGSQGQIKSAASGLIIATVMHFQLQNIQPIVLIDDAFDKLDSSRIFAVFQYLKASGVEQILISDTDSDRVEQILSKTDFDLTIFEVKNGKIQSEG